MKSILKTQTIKDATIVTLGMSFSALLGAGSIFLIARFLGPSQYGLYASALGIATILIDSLDLGIGSSIVNFASQKKSTSQSFVKYGFLLKLFIGIALGFLFALVSQPLAMFLHPAIKSPLLMTAFFIPVIFLLRFPRSILQAKKKYLKDVSIEFFTNLFRLSSILIFFAFFTFTANLAILAYLLGSILAFIIGSRFISWQFLKAKITPQTKKSFFSFQKWLTFGFILAAFHSRIDSAILLKLTDPETTGIYQAGYRFFMPAIQLASALSLVFAPRFAGFETQEQAKTYLKKAAKLTLAFGSLVLLIIPLAPVLIKLIFGSAYQASILPIRILAFGFVFFIAGSPFVSYLIYSVKKTKSFFYLSFFQLALLIILNLVLVPHYKAVGAALAASLTLIILNTTTALVVIKAK